MYAADVLWGLWEPIAFLGLSASYVPATVAQVVRASDWGAFASFDKFSYIWFANLWRFAGPMVREGAEARVVPLLQGRVRAGAIVSPADDGTPLPPGVGGRVIEIGPGSGNWVNIFADKYLPAQDSSTNPAANGGGGYRTRVDKVFGIEPNTDHHAALRARIVENGLEGRYVVVPAGIQDIEATGLVERESVDAIVTVMCLCSIPDPEKNIKELYTYLKPGGRWFVYEHVECHRSQGTFMKIYQRLLNVIWPSFMGGCDLCRDTASSIKAAGPWKEFDLAMPVDENWWNTTPHTYGILTK